MRGRQAQWVSFGGLLHDSLLEGWQSWLLHKLTPRLFISFFVVVVLQTFSIFSLFWLSRPFAISESGGFISAARKRQWSKNLCLMIKILALFYEVLSIYKHSRREKKAVIFSLIKFCSLLFGCNSKNFWHVHLLLHRGHSPLVLKAFIPIINCWVKNADCSCWVVSLEPRVFQVECLGILPPRATWSADAPGCQPALLFSSFASADIWGANRNHRKSLEAEHPASSLCGIGKYASSRGGRWRRSCEL